jgi:hypothetical protein
VDLRAKRYDTNILCGFLVADVLVRKKEALILYFIMRNNNVFLILALWQHDATRHDISTVVCVWKYGSCFLRGTETLRPNLIDLLRKTPVAGVYRPFCNSIATHATLADVKD